jgi:hypothetical protein
MLLPPAALILGNAYRYACQLTPRTIPARQLVAVPAVSTMVHFLAWKDNYREVARSFFDYHQPAKGRNLTG